MLKLFITAFIQVALVSANTYFLSRVNWVGVAICGYCISWVWVANVKKVVASNLPERVAYCLGACLGGLFGLTISILLTKK